MALLEVQNLKIYFYLRRGVVKAVDDVSFTVDRGTSLGIVGESGCGKTMTSLSILRLVTKPGQIVGGQILFDGVNLLDLSEKDVRGYRGKHISQIFQDPMASLNPVYTIGNQMAEGIVLHNNIKGNPLKERINSSLQSLGIPSPEIRVKDYPHQLSGGMRQRVVGAMSITCDPELIIADEPTTSLDVTVQMQYLNILGNIQKERGLALIFITHDMGIVAQMCDHVIVMYAGKIVERGGVRDIFYRATHPYTQVLMKSVPKMEESVDRLYSIKGQPPSLLNLPSGCAFEPRCDAEKNHKCSSEEFPPETVISPNHVVRCWNYV